MKSSISWVGEVWRSFARSSIILAIVVLVLVPSVLVGYYGADIGLAALGIAGGLCLISAVRSWLPGPSLFALLARGFVYLAREFFYTIWVGGTAFLRAVLQLRREEASAWRSRRHLILVSS